MLQANDLILFQGDSITDAFHMPGETGTSYRLGAGYAMLIAAQLAAQRPELNLRFENRGVSGQGVTGLANRWDEDTLALNPSVLSILVGVNETLGAFNKENPQQGPGPEDFAERYHALLTRTRDALPNVRLVLMEPFLLGSGSITPAHLEHIAPRQRVVGELAEAFDATHVPLQRRFDEAAKQTGPEYWLFDGIHPNASGQWLIAQAWLEATGALASGESH